MIAPKITRLEKEMAIKKLAIIKNDLNRIKRARNILTSTRARRGSLTTTLRNKENLRGLIFERQRLDRIKKETEALIRLEIINGTSIQTFASTPLQKSFLETEKGKLIQVLSQSKRPFFGGRRII